MPVYYGMAQARDGELSEPYSDKKLGVKRNPSTPKATLGRVTRMEVQPSLPGRVRVGNRTTLPGFCPDNLTQFEDPDSNLIHVGNPRTETTMSLPSQSTVSKSIRILSIIRVAHSTDRAAHHKPTFTTNLLTVGMSTSTVLAMATDENPSFAYIRF